MGKYTNYRQTQVDTRPWKIHPVWRGIGCVLIAVIPVMAYAASRLFLQANQQNQWVKITPELNKYIDLQGMVLSIGRILPGATGIFPGLGRIYYLDIFVWLAFVLLGFGLLTVLYSFLYSAMGGSHRNPYDVPPIRKSPRSHKSYD